MSARVSDQQIIELQEIIGPWMTGKRSNFDTVRDALLDLQELRAAVRDVQSCVNDSLGQPFAIANLIALLPER